MFLTRELFHGTSVNVITCVPLDNWYKCWMSSGHNSSKVQKLKESIGGKRTQFFVHGCFSYKVLQSSLRLKAKGVSDITIARIIGASSLSFLGGSELTASDRSCAINVISVSLRIKGMQMSPYFNLMIQRYRRFSFLVWNQFERVFVYQKVRSFAEEIISIEERNKGWMRIAYVWNVFDGLWNWFLQSLVAQSICFLLFNCLCVNKYYVGSSVSKIMELSFLWIFLSQDCHHPPLDCLIFHEN